MVPLLAQTDAAAGNTSWIVVGVIGALLAIGLNFFALLRIANGKANERQIEPTQLAAIQAELRNNHAAVQGELRTQTATLGKLDREMGGLTASVQGVQRELTEAKTEHRSAIEGVHVRLGGISRELAATSAKVQGLEDREKRS